MQTIRDRAADAIPGLATLSHMVGIDHLKKIFGGVRARTADGHRAQAKAAGMSNCIKESEGEEVGDMVATGDIHYHNPPPSAPAPAATGAATIATTALGAGGFGALAMALLSAYLSRPVQSPPVVPVNPPPVVAPVTPAKGQTWDITIKRLKWDGAKWTQEEPTIKPVQEK